jgi:glycosyltransferase involved in cell wall biosynthesis
MRICWVSPFNAKSAIARFSLGVVRELQKRGHSVTCVGSEVGTSAELPPLDPTLTVIAWDSPFIKTILDGADIIFVNVGNHFEFHGGMLPIIESHRCIGIFHDWYLFNFFQAWCGTQDYGAFRQAINETYGSETEAKLPSEIVEATFDFAVQHPMTEWISKRLVGAVVHANFYKSRVENRCLGPVTKIPLAYPFAPKRCMSEVPRTGRRLNLVTIGWVNPNKRVDTVIEALATSPALKENVTYTVAGPLTEGAREHLERVAKQFSFSGLRLLGEVSAEKLEECLSEADGVLCLRWPALEGASASAIEAMQSGKPVIVTDTAFYSELPDHLVYKVSPVKEREGIVAAVEKILNDPDGSRSMGSQAADWAATVFSNEAYVDRLIEYCTTYNGITPLMECVSYVGQIIAGMGLHADDPFTRRVGSAFRELWSDVRNASRS